MKQIEEVRGGIFGAFCAEVELSSASVVKTAKWMMKALAFTIAFLWC
jgi:hypothetical protein